MNQNEVPRRPQKKDSLPDNNGIEFFPVKKKPPPRHIKAPDGTPPRSPCASRGNSVGLFRTISPKMQIARFYFPHGPPALPRDILNKRELISEYFSNGPLSRIQFGEVAIKVINISSYLTNCLWAKCGLQMEQKMSQELFLLYWEKNLQHISDPKVRLHFVLQDETTKKIHKKNFNAVLIDIIQRQPGLQFLKSSPSFHQKYIETVVERIFYHICEPQENGITLNSLRKSNLYDCLNLLDTEDDINEIFDYFSYEHFYVIYCKFWELDVDHDFVINARDLEKYGDNALTSLVCDRICQGHGVPLSGPTPGTMTYQDFIYFIISEEDKTSSTSISYWFRLLDTDGDGILSYFELAQFWEQQEQRIREISPEEFLYRNLIAQFKDMIKPKLAHGFTLLEIQNSGLSGLFFNMIFNLSKFALHEQRDPYRLEQIRQNPHMSDWDRFAQYEYLRYAEEDGDDISQEECENN